MKSIFAALALIMMSSASAMSLDLPSAFFKQGHPLVGESLPDALDPHLAEESLDNLALSVERLKKYPDVQFQIAGHADPSECSGQACDSLALRRAQLVYRHLLHLGVDPYRLDALQGFGSSRPVDTSAPSRSWLNRRTEINVSN